MVIFWLLLPVLLYFSTRGNLLSKPSAIAGNYTSAQNEDSTQRGRIVVTASWGIAGVLMFTRRRLLMRAIKKSRLLLALPCFAILSALWSSNPFETLHRGVFILLSTVFALYLSRRLTSEQHLRLFYYVGMCAAVLSLLCVAALPAYGIGPDGAWKGIFGHKNDLGVFMVFLASPALYLPRRGGLARLCRICFLLMTLVLIAFSQSRSGWLVAIAYGAFFCASAILRRFSRRSRSLLLLVSLALALVVGTLVYQNYGAFLELIGKDATLSDRTEIWKAVMASIWKKPLLGYGYGAFWQGLLGPSADVIISIHFGIGHAHNGFLNVWLEMGIVGLALVVLVFARAGRQALKMGNWSPSARWYMGILFLVLVSNFDESFLFNTNDLIWMLFILAASQITWLYRSGRSEHSKRQAAPLLLTPVFEPWPQ
jgi:O-antigen ligase